MWESEGVRSPPELLSLMDFVERFYFSISINVWDDPAKKINSCDYGSYSMFKYVLKSIEPDGSHHSRVQISVI